VVDFSKAIEIEPRCVQCYVTHKYQLCSGGYVASGGGRLHQGHRD
jgi:hypothetical protein